MAYPWRLPPESLTARGDEVHVWRAVLDASPATAQALWQTLSADERARAERFHFQKDRERFVMARGTLRVILGRYLEEEPHRLRFRYGPRGKPALEEAFGQGQLCFNLSHSEALALYAVAWDREVGLDLEHIRPDLADEQVAEQFFAPAEVAALRALPAEAWAEAFFNCWTRKEAYVKARGEGLTLRLDQFCVSLVPGEPAALLSTAGNVQEAPHWSLRALAPAPGYVAALAAAGHGWRLRRWQWPAQCVS